MLGSVVCVWCIYVCRCLHLYMITWEAEEEIGWLLLLSALFPWEINSLNLELTVFLLDLCPASSSDLSVSTHRHSLGLPAFYLGAGDPNSGPQAHTAIFLALCLCFESAIWFILAMRWGKENRNDATKRPQVVSKDPPSSHQHSPRAGLLTGTWRSWQKLVVNVWDVSGADLRFFDFLFDLQAAPTDIEKLRIQMPKLASVVLWTPLRHLQCQLTSTCQSSPSLSRVHAHPSFHPSKATASSSNASTSNWSSMV